MRSDTMNFSTTFRRNSRRLGGGVTANQFGNKRMRPPGLEEGPVDNEPQPGVINIVTVQVRLLRKQGVPRNTDG